MATIAGKVGVGRGRVEDEPGGVPGMADAVVGGDHAAERHAVDERPLDPSASHSATTSSAHWAKCQVSDVQWSLRPCPRWST